MAKAGTYGPKARRRQLWWCYPEGAREHPERHRFSEELPRTLLRAEEGSFCAECTTHLELHEGPIHARTYEYPARQIAAALVAVGHGVSYEMAARTARKTNGAPRTLTTRRARFGANGTMVADWVGLYAPVVTRPLREGVSWPEVVALDELPFTGRRAKHSRQPQARKKNAAAWGVLAAYAYPETTDPLTGDPLVPAGIRSRGYLFALEAVPVLNSEQATKWLRSYPGRPKFVLADGSTLWAKAVREAWPDVVDETTGELVEAAPRLLPCLWHLSGVVRSWLRASNILAPREEPSPVPVRRKQTGVKHLRMSRAGRPRAIPADTTYSNAQLTPDENHPLSLAAHTALNSVADWDRFVELAYRWQAQPLLGRLEAGADIREVLATWPLGVARSIGGLEGVLRQVKFQLRPRAHSLTNAARTNLMLDLMVMHRRGLGDERAYTRALHDALQARAGRAAPQKAGITGGPRLHT